MGEAVHVDPDAVERWHAHGLEHWNKYRQWIKPEQSTLQGMLPLVSSAYKHWVWGMWKYVSIVGPFIFKE
jgi:hypothetical protein